MSLGPTRGPGGLSASGIIFTDPADTIAMERTACRIIALLVLAALLPHRSVAQPVNVPIGELTDRMRMDPRPALVLISTDWCTYCRMQRRLLQRDTTFGHALDGWYFTELNAETREPLSFDGRMYRFGATGPGAGIHELALALGRHQGRLAYPTWVFLDPGFRVLARYPGVLRATELRTFLEALQLHP